MPLENGLMLTINRKGYQGFLVAAPYGQSWRSIDLNGRLCELLELFSEHDSEFTFNLKSVVIL